MAKGHKIDVTEYWFEEYREKPISDNEKPEIDPETNLPKVELKKIKVRPKITLPVLLQNPNLRSKGQDDKYDLFEIGSIAAMIQIANDSVILDAEEYRILKERIKVIQTFLSGQFYEMIRRIHEAEEVDLIEEKKA